MAHFLVRDNQNSTGIWKEVPSQYDLLLMRDSQGASWSYVDQNKSQIALHKEGNNFFWKEIDLGYSVQYRVKPHGGSWSSFKTITANASNYTFYNGSSYGVSPDTKALRIFYMDGTFYIGDKSIFIGYFPDLVGTEIQFNLPSGNVLATDPGGSLNILADFPGGIPQVYSFQGSNISNVAVNTQVGFVLGGAGDVGSLYILLN